MNIPAFANPTNLQNPTRRITFIPTENAIASDQLKIDINALPEDVSFLPSPAQLWRNELVKAVATMDIENVATVSRNDLLRTIVDKFDGQLLNFHIVNFDMLFQDVEFTQKLLHFINVYRNCQLDLTPLLLTGLAPRITNILRFINQSAMKNPPKRLHQQMVDMIVYEATYYACFLEHSVVSPSILTNGWQAGVQVWVFPGPAYHKFFGDEEQAKLDSFSRPIHRFFLDD